MIVANLGRQHQRSLNSYFKSSYEYLYLFGVTSYYFISISLKLVAHITHVFVFPQYKYDTSIIRHVFLCFPDVSYQRGRTCVTFSFMKLPRKGILESTKSRTQAHIRFAPAQRARSMLTQHQAFCVGNHQQFKKGRCSRPCAKRIIMQSVQHE